MHLVLTEVHYFISDLTGDCMVNSGNRCDEDNDGGGDEDDCDHVGGDGDHAGGDHVGDRDGDDDGGGDNDDDGGGDNDVGGDDDGGGDDGGDDNVGGDDGRNYNHGALIHSSLVHRQNMYIYSNRNRHF